MIAEFLARANLTQEQAARLCGVSLKTISNWVNGHTQPSQQALAALECAADDVALESAEPMTLNEQIATLRGIQAMQSERARKLEDDLADTRRELAATTSRLNALFAERGKQEKA